MSTLERVTLEVDDPEAAQTFYDKAFGLDDRLRVRGTDASTSGFRGFTMSLSQDITGSAANSDFLLCVALDADGVPGGFLRLVPAYGGPATGTSFGYTLDLMRHDPGAASRHAPRRRRWAGACNGSAL